MRLRQVYVRLRHLTRIVSNMASEQQCRGCGRDVLKWKAGRRLLFSEKSIDIYTLWKNLVVKYETGFGHTTAGFLCRSCFSSYDRFLKHKKEIEENLEKAIAANPKRIRLESEFEDLPCTPVTVRRPI